jgi:hypothetical protein
LDNFFFSGDVSLNGYGPSAGFLDIAYDSIRRLRVANVIDRN